MKRDNRKISITFAGLTAGIILIFGVYWVFYLKKAHSTFENYYAFRGCQSLVQKADDYGICKLRSGETIKLVKFQGKWYLDGDLPGGFINF